MPAYVKNYVSQNFSFDNAAMSITFIWLDEHHSCATCEFSCPAPLSVGWLPMVACTIGSMTGFPWSVD